MDRLLLEIVGEKNISPGLVVAFFIVIGSFYILGAIYVIYTYYLNAVIFNTFSLLPDSVKPLFFPLLHSLLFLVLAFFSTFSSESSLGLSTIIGSDCFIILFFTGYASIKYMGQKKIMTLDPWVTFQDGLAYVIVLLCVALFLFLEWVNLISGIILLVLGLIYLIVLVFTDEIKIAIEDWLSLNDEEHDYSSDEHFQFKRRRMSSTQLRSDGHFDPSEPNLIKKLNRMEALLTIKFGTNASDHPQKRLYTIFQKSVYQIIFALRNMAKHEKQIRVEKYNEIYNPPKTKRNKQTDRSRSNENEQARIQDEEQKERQPNDSDPLVQEKQFADSEKPDRTETKHPSKFTRRENVDDEKYLASIYNEPRDPLQKVLSYLYLPIFILLKMLPRVDIVICERPLMLLVCLVIGFSLVTGGLFLIDWWLLEISLGSTIPIEVLGMVFSGVMLSFHFIEHVIRLIAQQTEIQLVQLFFQVAVIKLTICISIPWILDSIILAGINFPFASTLGFAIDVAILLGLVLVFMAISVLSRFRFGHAVGVLLITLYGSFIICDIVLLSVFK